MKRIWALIEPEVEPLLDFEFKEQITENIIHHLEPKFEKWWELELKVKLKL